MSAANNHYNRPKATLTADNGMVTTVKTAEKPNSPASPTAGSTGNLDCRIQLDSSGSGGGGAAIKDAFKIETAFAIDQTTGKMTITTTVTAIKGDGTAGTAISHVQEHDQTCDAWQTAAGVARA